MRTLEQQQRAAAAAFIGGGASPDAPLSFWLQRLQELDRDGDYLTTGEWPWSRIWEAFEGTDAWYDFHPVGMTQASVGPCCPGCGEEEAVAIDLSLSHTIAEGAGAVMGMCLSCDERWLSPASKWEAFGGAA